MAVDHKVTLTRAVERTFSCPRCGARGEVEFHAVGEGRWARESPLADLFNSESAVERSAQDAAAAVILDADRVLGLLRCPACEQRPPGALTWPAVRVGTPIVLAMIAPLVGGRLLLVGSAFFLLVAMWQLFHERRRLVRADRAEVRKLERGAGFGAQARAKASVPARRPVAAKPIVAAPAVPVPLVAPVIEKPRGPDEGPAFLRDDAVRK